MNFFCNHIVPSWISLIDFLLDNRPPPNGFLCFGPSAFISAAFCLSLFSSSLCNFVRLDDDNILRDTDFEFDKIGFWCFETTLNDNRYAMTELSTLDTNLERARKFGITANVFGFCVWMIYLFASCRRLPPKVFIFAGFLCYLACFFEGFKFWILRSRFFCDGDRLGCTIDRGGNCAISAIVLWFFAGKLVCAHTKERMNAGEEEENNNDDSGAAPAGNEGA